MILFVLFWVKQYIEMILKTIVVDMISTVSSLYNYSHFASLNHTFANPKMAGGVITPATAGKDYPGNLTCSVFITCIIAATGGLIFGYDLGISGILIRPRVSALSNFSSSKTQE